MLLKRVVVTYKFNAISGMNQSDVDEHDASETGAYLTVHNNEQGQLVVNNCREAEGRIQSRTLAVYNKDVWESWKEVRTDPEEQ